MPSGLHVRNGWPTYVSAHDVTVTLIGTDDAAVMGHDAKPSVAPMLVGWQNTSAGGGEPRRGRRTRATSDEVERTRMSVGRDGQRTRPGGRSSTYVCSRRRRWRPTGP